MAPLTDEETEAVDYIAAAFEAGAVVLVRTELDGRDVAALAVIDLDGESVCITPLAVLLDDELFARLTDPGADLLHPDLPADEADPDFEYDDRVNG